MPIVRVPASTFTTSVFNGWITSVNSVYSTTTSSGAFEFWVNDRHQTSPTTNTIFSNWVTYTTEEVWPERQTTPEQLALLQEEATKRAQARKEAERKKIIEERRANRRALVLLLHTLVDEQRADFRQHGYFHVRGGASGIRYRIRKGRVANIDVFDGAEVKHRLCAHPGVWTPDYDTMAAQALHLGDAANESAFVSVANIHPVPRARTA